MNNLNGVWSQTRLSLATKLRLYMTLIVPILLYASEIWTINQADLDRLQAFHMRCQRRILGVRWFDRIKNITISNRTKLPPISDMITSRRHSLFGHVVRMNGSFVPREPSSYAQAGHIHEASPPSKLEETSRPPSQHMGRSHKEGWGRTNINGVDPGIRSRVVAGTARRLQWLRGRVSE